MADDYRIPQPLQVRMPMRGNSAKDPVFANVTGGMSINVNNRGNQPIPVAVQRALPYLQAKNYVTQDLSKYLMFPQRMYDILDWGAAGVGQTNYTFFARSFGNGTVSLEDTNMPQANNFGQNNAFVCTRISVQFLSGLNPVITGTDAAITGANAVNDANRVLTRGAFQLNINGQGQFFNALAPLTCLPAPNYMKVSGGIATGNAAADLALMPEVGGDFFSFLETPITIIGGASFNAQIMFPDGPLTLPSANGTSRIAVYMDGYFMRPAG